MKSIVERAETWRDDNSGSWDIQSGVKLAYMEGAHDERQLMFEFINWYSGQLSDYCAGGGHEVLRNLGAYSHEELFNYWVNKIKK